MGREKICPDFPHCSHLKFIQKIDSLPVLESRYLGIYMDYNFLSLRLIFCLTNSKKHTPMPEGPSIVILKEAVLPLFKGKKVTEAIGNSKKIDLTRLQGEKVIDFKSWGKHFLICFPKFTVRIHFLLFGSYRINEEKDSIPRLGLYFGKDQLNFYACSVQVIEVPLDETYDWTADVMNPDWDSKQALKKLRAKPETLVCDALLDQNIFAGVGNIIKTRYCSASRYIR